LKLPFFILGGGSNVLFPDKGFNGLVIKIEMHKIEINDNEISAEAGAKLSDIVKLSQDNSLKGFEWAAGIPGVVGGAVCGNAQAFREKMSDSIKEVEALNIKTLKIIKFSNTQCRFKTKNSIFKNNKNLIILSAVLKLEKGDKDETNEIIKEHLSYRKKYHPINFPSAGSVFINQNNKIKNKNILEKYPKIREFNEKGIIHVGYLIEECGLKGKKIGQAEISNKHGNFIVNLGGAKSKDVSSLIKLIKQKVKNKFAVSLKEEIQIVSSPK
jgi:UDP-N-acetylmuramate dehydrogenase